MKLVKDDINNGAKINKLFTEFLKIKSRKQHTKFMDKIVKIRFGTYKQYSILDIMENFNPLPIEGMRKDFINEVSRVLVSSK